MLLRPDARRATAAAASVCGPLDPLATRAAAASCRLMDELGASPAQSRQAQTHYRPQPAPAEQQAAGQRATKSAPDVSVGKPTPRRFRRRLRGPLSAPLPFANKLRHRCEPTRISKLASAPTCSSPLPFVCQISISPADRKLISARSGSLSLLSVSRSEPTSGCLGGRRVPGGRSRRAPCKKWSISVCAVKRNHYFPCSSLRALAAPQVAQPNPFGQAADPQLSLRPTSRELMGPNWANPASAAQ